MTMTALQRYSFGTLAPDRDSTGEFVRYSDVVKLIWHRDELLAACQEAIRELQPLLANRDIDPETHETVERLRAAISKAGGWQPRTSAKAKGTP